MKSSTIFWLWLLASVVGWFFGRFAGGIVADEATHAIAYPAGLSASFFEWAVMIVTGGILVSIIQGFFLPDSVLRHFVGEIKSMAWTLVSILGWITAGAIAIAFYGTRHSSGDSELLQGLFIIGALAGTVQWFILRSGFRWAGVWIVANAISVWVVSNCYGSLDIGLCMNSLISGAVAGFFPAGTMAFFCENWAKEQPLQQLAGGSAAGGEQRIATPDPFINREVAIDIALKISSTSHPEMSGALTKPEDIHAELTTLAMATQRLTGSDDVGAGYSPDMAVWLVTMDVTRTDEFPRQTDVPAPEPYRHYGVILDARSGESISTSARP